LRKQMRAGRLPATKRLETTTMSESKWEDNSGGEHASVHREKVEAPHTVTVIPPGQIDNPGGLPFPHPRPSEPETVVIKQGQGE
jgi:hypothetical protein